MDDEPNERNVPSIVISDEECPLPDSTMSELAENTEGSYVTDENNWILISDTSADGIVSTTSKKKKRKCLFKNKNRSSRHGFNTATTSKARRLRHLEQMIGTRPNRSTLQKTRCIFHRSGKSSFVMPPSRRRPNTSTQNNEIPAVRPTIDVQSTPKSQSTLNTSAKDELPNPERVPSSLPKRPFNFVERFQIKPTDKMVAIGSGHTLIDRFNFQVCDWSCHRAATNRLLMGVFGKKILATHTLTGKSSPAFKDKMPMKKLDPKKVADIVMTVSEVCNVPENLVRKCISTKCSSEKKLHSMRKAKKNYLKTLRSQNSSIPDSQTTEIEDQVKMIAL